MILDVLKQGETVYCREREGRLSVTTVARFDKKVETLIDLKDEDGKIVRNKNGDVVQKIVTDYYLWDLRSGKSIVNPTNAWRTASEYQALRGAKKVKLHGDFDESDDKVDTKRAKV